MATKPVDLSWFGHSQSSSGLEDGLHKRSTQSFFQRPEDSSVVFRNFCDDGAAVSGQGTTSTLPQQLIELNLPGPARIVGGIA